MGLISVSKTEGEFDEVLDSTVNFELRLKNFKKREILLLSYENM